MDAHALVYSVELVAKLTIAEDAAAPDVPPLQLLVAKRTFERGLAQNSGPGLSRKMAAI